MSDEEPGGGDEHHGGREVEADIGLFEEPRVRHRRVDEVQERLAVADVGVRVIVAGRAARLVDVLVASRPGWYTRGSATPVANG